MHDRLSALLDCFRLRARVFHTGSLCDTADFDAHDGVGHLHVLRGGTLRIGDAVAGESTIDEPSLIFYPRPAPHWIRGEGTQGADLVCSSIELGADAGNPLTHSLPARLVLPLRDNTLLRGTLELLFEEAFAGHCGRQAALDRLSELMILQLLRHCMTAGVVAQGVLAGLADPRLAKALNAMHGAPGDAWTLDGLARVSGMSRARFAAHFHHVVGTPPGDYLADWRISVAKTLLKRGHPLKNVALDVGYASASAFARAFAARHSGTSPTAWLSASGASPSH